MPHTRGGAGGDDPGDQEVQINTLTAAVDNLQANLTAQSKAAEKQAKVQAKAVEDAAKEAAKDAKEREDRLRQEADARAKSMEDQMSQMMAQLTALAGQGAVAAGGQPPAAPPAANPAAPPAATPSTTPPATPQVQVTGATGRHWKPPNASDVQMLDSDVTPQSLKRWRRVWESFESQHDLVGYPKHQQYGTLMSRLTIALQRIIDVRCSVDLDDKNQTPTEILDSLAAYLKSAQHEAKDNLAF